MDKDKLNKKLAEFGKPEHEWKSAYDKWGTQRCSYCGNLNAIAGTISPKVCQPDFTDPIWGIAYCFKWLVPKLPGIQIHIYYEDADDKWQVTVHDVRKSLVCSQTGYANTPALALCLAIEKLIDK